MNWVKLEYLGGFVASYSSDAPMVLSFSGDGNLVTLHMDGHPYEHSRSLLKCMASSEGVMLSEAPS